MKTTETKACRLSLRALTMTHVLALLGVLLLGGTALAAAKPGKPTAKTPEGVVETIKPAFTWSKAPGAAKYALRVYEGSTPLLTKTGIAKRSWKSTEPLPTNVDLTWKVRASNAAGAGAWSKSLTFRIVPPALAIGQAYQGGRVAYIDGTGLHGLIAAAADQSTGIVWAVAAFESSPVPGGTLTALGTGAANTTNIITQNGAGGTYAAGLAGEYTSGIYSDWYLPSRDELNQLYVNHAAIGGFDESVMYWSSSEDDADRAWYEWFGIGARNSTLKDNTFRVRAVRSF
jgi:hypothetical protein